MNFLTILALVVDTILLLAVLPIYRDFWWRDIIRGKDANGAPKYNKVEKSLWTFLFMFILSAIVLFNYTRVVQAVAELQPFGVDDYMDEVSLSVQAGIPPELKSLELYQTMLLRELFARAVYATKYKDFEEAIKLYEILDTGNYPHEKIIVIPSACVKNNLAILYYLSNPKDKEKFFKAGNNLTAGKNLAEKEYLKRFREKIDKNYFIFFKT